MKKKYDVAVYGLWYGNNYGSIITYYALTRVLEEMNYSYAMIRNPLGRELDINKLNRSHPLKFAKKKYDITPLLPIDRLHELNDSFSAFLLGSDQMWNYHLSRPYGQSYFFDFVADNNGKIAYATSFGKETYIGPEDEKEKTFNNLHRFDAISVRDDFSQKICKEDFNISAELLVDPVFLSPVSQYDELINEALDFHVEGKYIFAYILDPNEKIGESIQHIAEHTKTKVLVVFNESGDKENFKERLNISSPLVSYELDPTVNEWLYLYKYAEYVLTDSFHGTCFSIIFQKPFIVLKNIGRGGARFPFLLGELGLMERMVEKPEDFMSKFEILDNDIDYKRVNAIIEEKRKYSLKWLKKYLDRAVHNEHTVNKTVNPKNCTGCAACANVCPNAAIEMRMDQYGYYVPEVITEKCIDCGKCTKVCPTLGVRDNNNNVPKLYEFQTKNSQILYASSSGGFFTTIASKVLNKNGLICGAAWNKDLYVEHILIDNIEEISKLQKSKYLQSYISENLYKEIKKDLQNGKFVMFTGCPCQVAGIRNYLDRDYDNLLLIDLLCGNAPSAKFFQMYLKDDVSENIVKYEFRSKKHGWNAECEEITFDNGKKEIRHGKSCDEYQRVYHNHTMCAYHCENCKYQSFPRLGDITMGDFWWIGKHDKEIDTQGGVSAVLINNLKGRRWFDCILDEEGLKKEVPVEWLNGNGGYKGNWAGEKRDLFYQAILTKGFHEAADYALKANRGNYRKIYASGDTLLQYDRISYQFTYNSAWWEQHVINGFLTLMVKPGQSKVGRYAVMQLGGELKKGFRYRFSVKYKIKSNSDVINFHIKDSGSSLHQVILSRNIKEKNNATEWLEDSIDFVPNANIYDQFMIGASQVNGNNNYISFAYINIVRIN